MRIQLFARFSPFACLLSLCVACESVPPEVPKQDMVHISSEQVVRMADSIEQNTPVQLADGLTLNLWASDSLLEDPVALYMDVEGKAWVTSTDRGQNSEFDIRSHRDWMTQSISWTSPEDRRAFIHSELPLDSGEVNAWFPDLNGDSLYNWHDLTVESERVIQVEDTDGDGLADQSHTFVAGFNTEISDVAGAFTEYNGEYFLGVAPDLWRLRDRNNDGTVDEMTSILHGFQVHIGFGGHGMSGLKVGPDGRLYWSIGDIGFNISDQDGKQWFYPNQGAIFRANPDGSDFEVYAAGLRNTHEFDFDAYGNLISVDNDGDYPGEMERLVYIVHGSDAGWRANWQYGKYTDPKNNRYNVWMDEKLFVPRFDGQAAHIIPPIKNYHAGPTGMKYQPGTALGGRWHNHFFLVEFPGSPARAKIHALELEPKGAGFQLKQEEVIAKGVLATGLDIGADGALYVSDWITGWVPKSYGRIWKLDDKATVNSSQREEVRQLLRGNWQEKPAAELVELLAHEDRRIRQQAQFELVGKGAAAADRLLREAESNPDQLVRIHAIWGYTQLVRKSEASAEHLARFLTDEDAEIRAQAAKMIGDVRFGGAGEQLIRLLVNPSARVRFFAAEAIARTAYAPAVDALVRMLEENNDDDVYLRHAGAFALASIGETEPLVALADHPQRAVRIAAVVALRRMKAPAVAIFLDDPDEWVVTEAAKAIHDDWSISKALPRLAAYLDRDRGFQNEALMRRVLSANSRLGSPEALQRLVAFSVNDQHDASLRTEALRIIAVWEQPSETDRVDGRYRGNESRDSEPARRALALHMSDLLMSREESIIAASLEVIGGLKMDNLAPAVLGRLLRDAHPAVREMAVSTMALLETPELASAISIGLEDRNARVRERALELVPDLPLGADEKVALLQQVIQEGDIRARQRAISSLAQLPLEATGALLDQLLSDWEAGTLNSAFQLELGEVIATTKVPERMTRLVSLRAVAEDPLKQYADALTGGNPGKGRGIVYWNSAAQCVRCHSVGSQQGAEVGPSLEGVGSRLSRESLLLSLVDPSHEIASGYGAATVTLKNGEKTTGILLEETRTEIRLQTDRAEPVRYPKANIERLQLAPSSMPNMGLILSRREIRDVVAFLAELE